MLDYKGSGKYVEEENKKLLAIILEKQNIR